jgi:hypothetical protein
MSVFGLIDSSTDELPYAHSLIKRKEAKKKPADTKEKRKKSLATKSKQTNSRKKKKNNDETVANEDESKIEDEDELEEEDEVEKLESSEEDNDKENSSTTAEVDLTKFSIYFRDFDLSIINFVNLELDLAATDDIPSSASFSSIDMTKTKCKLKPHLLNAILLDFNQKISQVFKLASGKSFGGMPTSGSGGLQASSSSSKVTKSQLFAQLNAVDAKALARHLVDNCLDSLFNHMDAINKHIRSIQAKYDDMKDPNEICNNSANICLLKCLNQIIKLFNTFFTWLNSNNEVALLTEVIKKLTMKINESSGGNRQETMITTQIDKVPELFFYNYVARLKDVILDLNTMNDLVKLLDLLCNKVIVNKRNNAFKKLEKKFRLILTTVCLSSYFYKD